MAGRLLDYDPTRGVMEVFHYDPQDDSFFIETLINTEGLIEENKSAYNQTKRHTPWGDHDVYARIPINVYWEIWKTGLAHDERAFRRWLDDPDQRVFKMRAGSISK